MRTPRAFLVASCMVLVALVFSGCGGGSKSSTPSTPPVISITLANSTVVVPQDGVQATLGVTITGATGTATVTVTGPPSGIATKFTATAGGPSGQLTFTGASTVPAGSYPAVVNVSLAGASATQAVTLISAPVARVSTTVDTSLGVKGKLDQFMATSFQIYQYTGDIFGTGTTAIARQQQLNNLGALHNRLQVIMDGMPMKSNTGTASDWDFTLLDQTAKPVLDASPDHSPEFQIAAAPYWMCDSSGHLLKAHFADFATYAANLVRYYNKGGFDWGGQHFQSAAPFAITWWGIYNEYNLTGMTAADYLDLYDTVVPAMLAVDSTLKFSALELSDFDLGTGDRGDPMQALPVFLSTSSTTGVKSPVDVLSTHLYGSCNQSDPDVNLFNNVPVFAENIAYFLKALTARPDLANTQIWVTENNVNADFNDGTGKSNCNPAQTFVTDKRGTSAFFAAWRPYVFSQLGKTGNRALYHWDYSADQQYGEVGADGTPYLSYWVDRTLAKTFPTQDPLTHTPSQDILTLTATDTSSIETLATRSSDGKVHILVVDRAVSAATDNNGPGAPRTVVIDTSTFGNFTAASLLTIDATTSLPNGPAATAIPPATRTAIPLNGYGFAILTLTP